jgi:hypothetical protein
MNEVKLSTNLSSNARLAIKLNVKELGVNWSASDIIRVISHKSDGTIILKKVNKKVKKTVSHTLTKTGGGDFSHDLGLYVKHTNRRFEKAFKPATSVNAGARFLDQNKTTLEVYMPKEIYIS